VSILFLDCGGRHEELNGESGDNGTGELLAYENFFSHLAIVFTLSPSPLKAANRRWGVLHRGPLFDRVEKTRNSH
jgi:hypothetical protein